MDERALKRLLIIVAVSIGIIWLFKSMMTKSIVNLNKAVVEKKQLAVPASAPQLTDAVPEVAPANEMQAASPVDAASAVEPSAVSAVVEAK